MITVTMKDNSKHYNLKGEADRDGQILMIYGEDGLMCEFNDTWAFWFEHELPFEVDA